jgi:hypothetical protein
MLSRKIYLILFTAFIIPVLTMAQVTTSSITGTVTTTTGEGLEGATVVATHTPSGTVYSTASKKGGSFTLPAVRIGGPYSVVVSYVGYGVETANDIFLSLGVPYSLNVVMGAAGKNIGTVTVSANATRRRGIDKTGAATVVGQRQITTLPTISRSITDFTRLTPQASGTNFAGRDARYNNVQVDGANLNNNFGLSSDPLPGGGNNPISIDAIEEISVNIAPYDVRQGNFTGAGISAVTKSGTNTFRGSAYTFYRDQTFNGARVADVKLPAAQATKNTIYGATLGGPIIKNKLFFFISGELEQRTFPGIQFSPTGGSGSGNVSATPIDSLRKFSNFLKEKYGYETGKFDNFENFKSNNHKILGKIDWNISNGHKLTFKYNELVSENDVQLNALSVPGSVPSSIITSVARFGLRAFSFENSNYAFRDVVRSGSLELNSNFSGKFANQFIATLTKIKSTRTSPSAPFPFIDILNGGSSTPNNNYMSAGYEPFSYNNDVINDVYTVTNNFSYFAGKHTLTAGASYEYQRVGNMFMSPSQSYYVFGSLNDFITNQAPKAFALNYSIVPGEDAVYSANLKIGQFGVYVQDEVNVNPRTKITGGLRVDAPVYHEQPLENPAISALTFPGKNGEPTKYSTGNWPKSKPYFSPRVGIRWDVKGDKNMIIRGGTGVFTGRIPFVYLTNIPTNSGMYQVTALVTNTAQLNNFKFNKDIKAYNPFYNQTVNTLYPTTFPKSAGTAVPTAAYALTSEDFSFPQVWRTNAALDQQLGSGWSYTLELLYSKDINSVYMRNANQNTPDTVVVVAPNDIRPRFSSANSNASRKIYAQSGNAIVLENTSRGSSFVFTAQLSKAFANGFYGSIAYNYTLALDVTANPGSQANSVWQANPTSRTQNDLELSYSNFATPHRVVGNISYRREYLKSLATTVSLFYEGSNPVTYSYIYNGDVNNDANSADLMYIPKNASEINFLPLAASGTTPAFTAAQQSEAFFKYIAQDRYLRKHQGEVAERFGARLPWYNRVDFKLAQDIFHNFGGRKTTLQLTADVTNFLNLLNRDWGVRQQTVVNNPLRFVSYTNGRPNFTLATYNNGTSNVLVDKTFINTVSSSSTWGAQLGLRLLF